MKAVDTNLVVRVLMEDNPVQSSLARSAMADGAFVPLTVLLETAWLLRSRYRLSRGEVVDALRVLRDLPGVVIPDADLVGWAIGRFATRGDFADLVHLVASHGAEAFITFDQALASAAGPDAPLPIETLPV